MKKNFLSIIIPFYNEEMEIQDLFNDILIFENKYSTLVLEYIFIDDCSTDRSLKILNNKLKEVKTNLKKKIKIFKNVKNLGWSRTLIKGYSLVKGEYSLFIPGDGEAKLTEFLTINNTLSKDILIFQRKSMPGRPLIRVVISHMYRYFISFIFFIKKMDFNGLIIIKTKKISELNLSSDSFFISAEIIIKSLKKKFTYDNKYKFKLFPKKHYKSTSLSFLQLKKIIIDILKTYKYFILN